MVDIFD